MKGIVFTKFLEMVEQRYSADIVDDLIDALGADADADGSYTAVGYYAHHQFLTLVETLATKTGQSKHACCVEFGDYLIADLAKLFPDFFNGHPDVFSFLTLIGQVIEDEAKKLYPETNHPELSVIEQDGTRLVVNYALHRPLADMAEGKLLGSINHFVGGCDGAREDKGTDGRAAVFTITKAA